MEINNIISNVVKGFELKEGKVILLNFWGENSDLGILDQFALEVIKAGAMPIRWQQSRELNKEFFNHMNGEKLGIPEKYFDIFKVADGVIDIFMYGVAPHREFPKDKFGLYSQYMQKLFGALVENKELFVQVRIPTEENAIEADIDFQIYKNSMYQAMSVDYQKLKDNCRILENKLKGKKTISIITAENHTLTLYLGDREWQKDDGTGDIPSGEIYIAPIEESANGTILIPLINLDGEILKDVTLEFKAGKLVYASEDKLIEFINRFPGDKDVIAEFGIGLNDKVEEIIGYTVLDEKIKGTAHIAIGMNKLFGGNNSSQLHMDFVFEPKSILIDDEVLMDKAKVIF